MQVDGKWWIALSACGSLITACSGSEGASQTAGTSDVPASMGTPGVGATGPSGTDPGSPTSGDPAATGGTPIPSGTPADSPQTPTMTEMPLAGSGAMETPEPPAGSNCLQGTGAFDADGPYGVGMMDVEIGTSGMFTIFYPEPLDATCLHPIVAWGNGTGVTGSGTYAFYHQHAASWGIVTVASHNSNTGSGDFHRAGLDYLLAENADAGSPFYGKLSTRAGTSGHSQGGMGANAGSDHPNVEAEVNVQGAFGFAPAGVAFLCLTGTQDIAIDGCRNAVNGTASPALYANWEGGTHTGTATIGGFFSGDLGTLQYRRFNTAWFRCFLADDTAACALFEGGATCPVCTDSGWAEIFAKNY